MLNLEDKTTDLTKQESISVFQGFNIKQEEINDEKELINFSNHNNASNKNNLIKVDSFFGKNKEKDSKQNTRNKAGKDKSYDDFLYKTDIIRNISPVSLIFSANKTNKSFKYNLSQNPSPDIFLSSKSIKKTKFNVKFVKKEDLSKSYLSKWKTMNISNLVKSDRLTSQNKDVMIFNSELTKYSISSTVNEFYNFCLKFCLLTKNEFILFPSKESFLRLQNQNPYLKLSLKNISRVDRLNPNTIKFKINKEFHYLYVKMLDIEDEKI